MTNREWLLKKMQNMSDEEISYILKTPCAIFENVEDCDDVKNRLGTNILTCRICAEEWLKAEHKEKITLSEAERVILKNMKGEEWITREKCGRLCVYHLEKPYKDNECEYWKGQACTEIGFFDHLFQFIKWEDEEPYNIEELLKGE
jgi:hypothetical protein